MTRPSEGGFSAMGSGQPAYWTSKAAVEALSRLSAAELAGTGILTNAVCAYWTALDMGCGGRPISAGATGIVWAALLPPDGLVILVGRVQNELAS